MASPLQILVVAVVVAAATPAAAQQGNCPLATDTKFGTSCFEFIKLADPISYEDASIYCETRGKQLAHVRSDEEQQFLANSIESRGWSNALIGLRFRTTSWRWLMDGSPTKGQGCYDNDGGSSMVNSVERNSTYSLSMTVDRCLDFCKSAGKPFAALQAGSFCYCTSKYAWTSAASNCSMPCSGDSSQLCGNLWISYGYHTSDDSYDNWLPGRPTSDYGCAAMVISSPKNYWTDLACSTQMNFMCQFRKF